MNNNNAFFDLWSPRLLSVLRIIAGFMFIQHGAQKLFGMFDGHAVQIGTQIGVGGLLEFVGGVLLLFGLFTRIASFILSGQMAVAYFQFHAKGGLWPVPNKGEPAVLYCFLFLYLVAAGGGAWSFDSYIAKAKNK